MTLHRSAGIFYRMGRRGEEDTRQVLSSGVVDTSPDIDEILVEGYRHMEGREKLRRVVSLNRSLERLARAGIRSRYGDDISERDMRLRLAALRIERRLMVEAFGWDPEEEGY